MSFSTRERIWDAALMILLSSDLKSIRELIKLIVMSLGNYKNTVGKIQISNFAPKKKSLNLLKIHNSSKKYLNDHLKK